MKQKSSNGSIISILILCGVVLVTETHAIHQYQRQGLRNRIRVNAGTGGIFDKMVQKLTEKDTLSAAYEEASNQKHFENMVKA